MRSLATDPFSEDAIAKAVRDVEQAELALQLINPSKWQDMPTPELGWALHEYIPERQATYITGPGSAGKSLLGQQFCSCSALGLPFMGVAVRQAVALYVTCEDDELELHRRQKAICQALGVPLSALDGKLYLVSLAGSLAAELATFGHGTERGETSPTMRTTPQWDALCAAAKAIGAGFITLDNVAHFFAGNENVRHEVAQFVSLLNRLAISINGAVLFIGHPNKAGDSFSGSTAWENQVRSRLFLETPKEADGETIDRDARVLTRQKSNYAANGAKLTFRWHRGTFVHETALPSDYWDHLQRAIECNRDDDRFLACLAERNRQKRPVSEHPSANYAPKQFSSMPESKGIGKTRLSAAMDRLFRVGRIERGIVCRDEQKRRDHHGLIEVHQAPQTPAPNAPQRLAPDRPKLLTQTAPNTPPIPKGIRGATLGSAAPSPDGQVA